MQIKALIKSLINLSFKKRQPVSVQGQNVCSCIASVSPRVFYVTATVHAINAEITQILNKNGKMQGKPYYKEIQMLFQTSCR